MRVYNSLCELYRSYFEVCWMLDDDAVGKPSSSSSVSNPPESTKLSHRSRVTLSWSTARPGARQLLDKRSSPIPIGIIRAALYLLCSAALAHPSDAAGNQSPALRSLGAMLMRDGRPPRAEFVEKTLSASYGSGVWNSILDDALMRHLLQSPVSSVPKGFLGCYLPELDARRVLYVLLEPGAEHLLSNPCVAPSEPPAQCNMLSSLVKELEDRAGRARVELVRALDTLPDALRHNTAWLVGRLAAPNAHARAPQLLALLRQQFPATFPMHSEASSPGFSSTDRDTKIQAICKQFQAISSRPKRLFWV